MTIQKFARSAGMTVIFLASMTTVVYGQGRDRYRGHWEYLGNAHVDGGVDHDNIHVGTPEGRFRAIQLRVRGGAVDFERVVVHYGDGEPEELHVREHIRDGGSTRPIDLRGYERYIRSVELWYSRGGWHRRPEVQLYGLR